MRSRDRLLAMVAALAVVLGLTVSASVPGSAFDAGRWPGGECPETLVLFARGSNEAPVGSVSVGEYGPGTRWGTGRTGELLVDELRASAATAWGHRGVVYPALGVRTVLVEPGRWAGSVQAGADEIAAVLTGLQTSCARSPDVVLGGFSQGALVVRRALTDPGLPPALLDRVRAVVLLGDPAYDSTEPIVHGQSWERPATGMVQTAVLDTYGLHRPFPTDLAPRVASYCTPTDPVCDLHDDLRDVPVLELFDGMSGPWEAHGSYGEHSPAMRGAVDHVLRQLGL